MKQHRASTSLTKLSSTFARMVFWLLLILSVVLYLGAHQASHWDFLDIPRALIPPAAFVLCTILQKTSAFDAIWPDAVSDGGRLSIGAIGAVFLGVIAARLGVQADKSTLQRAEHEADLATGKL